MNLPFGLPNLKDTVVRKKDDTAEATVLYEHKLAQYRDALENYKKCILEYSSKLESYDKRTLDNQLSIVQTALDITYLKEQGDKSIELLENMKVGQLNQMLSNLESMVSVVLDTNYKLEGLDKNVVNRLTELLDEQQKQAAFLNKQRQIELLEDNEKLVKTMKRGHILLWLILVFNIFGLSALAFLILYIMDIIPLK